MQHLLEPLAVLGHVDHVGRRADNGYAVRLEIARELERRLAAVLHDHAERLFDVHDLQHILQGQRLEIEPVGRVVVGGHGLRIAVDHDRLVAVFAQRQRRVDAAIVELDSLPDPVRSAAQHDHLAAVGRMRLALVFVGRVHVGGPRRELRGAGVDALVHRPYAEAVPARTHLGFAFLPQMRQPAIGKSHALQRSELVSIEIVESALFDRQFGVDDFLDLRQEPAVDSGVRVDFFQRHADRQRIGHVPQALGAWVGQLVGDRVGIDGLEVEAVDAAFQPAQRLLQRFLERAADCHHLADRFHLRRQPVVGLLEFLECEARHLGDHVIDRRLERRRGLSTGDIVLQFVERVADGELGRDLGDRKAGRLRRQRRAARHARIHLDDDHASVVGVDRELHVRSAGVDADLAQHRDRRVAHDLVFLVGQGLRRRNGDRVAGVHAHRVDVFDRADDDAVVLAVAHDLHLELFPAEQRFLDQQLVRRRAGEPALAHFDEFVLVVGDAAAGTAQRERRPDHRREADVGLHLQRLLEIVRDA